MRRTPPVHCRRRRRRRRRRRAIPCLHTRHADLAGRTPNQVQYLRQMLAQDISFGIGPAGTGKTFLAVACAVDALERSAVQRIVLTRPAVEAGERLGFLPGDLAQKVDPYLRPLYDALYDLMGFDRVGRAFEKGLLEIAPLAFMRGRTLNHAFVILDEAQNTHARADEDVPHAHRLRQQVRDHRRRQPDRPAQGPAQRPGRRRAGAGARSAASPSRTFACRRRGAPPAGGAHRRGLRQGGRSRQRRAAMQPELRLSLQFADPRHRALLPRHRVARCMRAALEAPAQITVRIVGCRRGPGAEPRLPAPGPRHQCADLRLRTRAGGRGRPGAVRPGARARGRRGRAGPWRTTTRTCWCTARCMRRAGTMCAPPTHGAWRRRRQRCSRPWAWTTPTPADPAVASGTSAARSQMLRRRARPGCR